MKLRIVVRKIEDNLFLASCPALKGCHVEAESEAQAQSLIKAALQAYLTSYKQRHEKVSFRN